MSEIIKKDMIVIAVSPLHKNMSVVTVTLWTHSCTQCKCKISEYEQQVSGKSVTLLKRFSSCKKIMRITKDLSSLLLVTT